MAGAKVGREITSEMLAVLRPKMEAGTEMIPFHPCWEWGGSARANGYGQVSYRLEPRRWASFLAHRVAWTLANGAIPDGLLVCHRCDNRGCVRPSHLFLGTYRDNARDMVAKDRHPASARPRPACIHGHRLTEGNYRMARASGGWIRRVCIECSCASNKAYRARQKARALADRIAPGEKP